MSQKSSTASCPISPDRVNENVARITAFYVILISLLGFITNSAIVFLLLGIDFAIRSFSSGESSPIRFLAKLSARMLNVPAKLTDAAPKKFAAGVGLVFAFVIGLALYAGFPTAAFIAGAILLVCAGLEGFFGFCVGCVVYAKLIAPFLKFPEEAI
ncbi:MAG: DUF4395 domain-containing protein [Saprospiraceae bacterium]